MAEVQRLMLGNRQRYDQLLVEAEGEVHLIEPQIASLPTEATSPSEA